MKKVFWDDYYKNINAGEDKTIGINDFVKRQTKSDFVGTKVTIAQLEKFRKEAERAINAGRDKKGYADFVRIVTIRDSTVLCPIAKITPENKKLARNDKIKEL